MLNMTSTSKQGTDKKSASNISQTPAAKQTDLGATASLLRRECIVHAAYGILNVCVCLCVCYHYRYHQQKCKRRPLTLKPCRDKIRAHCMSFCGSLNLTLVHSTLRFYTLTWFILLAFVVIRCLRCASALHWIETIDGRKSGARWTWTHNKNDRICK